MKKISYSPKTPEFNPLRDFERVVPNLAVDVGEIMATGVVASTGDTTPYTKETEISEIGHYVTDKISGVISAIRLNKSVAGNNSQSPSPSNSQPSKTDD